ncbi:UNVERIFIED_CONTAM: hypothetical protein HDU68_006909 [Siphonaria sp. JEL0065]|nr:hypothetical protein HDU68_006909 [Siphonaria sp. JEL0065]
MTKKFNSLLAANGSPVVSLFDWKEDLKRTVNSVAVPKKFLGPKVPNAIQGQLPVYQPITEAFDLLQKEYHYPNTTNYGDQAVGINLETYVFACQCFSKLTSDIKTAVKPFLSDNLFKIFCSASTLYEGYQSVLTDTKNFSDIQKAELYVKIRAAYQGNRVYYEYLTEYHSWYLELTRLGETGDKFEADMAENFRLGISEQDVHRLTALFNNKSAVLFEEMRKELVLLAAEDLRRETRAGQGGVVDPAAALQLDGNPLRGYESSRVSSNGGHRDPRQSHEDPNKKLVARNLPFSITEDAVKSAFQRFGIIKSVHLHRGLAFIEYEDPSSVDCNYCTNGWTHYCDGTAPEGGVQGRKWVYIPVY